MRRRPPLLQRRVDDVGVAGVEVAGVEVAGVDLVYCGAAVATCQLKNLLYIEEMYLSDWSQD